jgi:hypothetical protein
MAAPFSIPMILPAKRPGSRVSWSIESIPVYSGTARKHAASVL